MKQSRIFIAYFFLSLVSAATIQAQIYFPSDAVVNILDYGDNLNDGITDATAAINAAIDDHDLDLFRRKVLYFPPGVYLVSGPIDVEGINETEMNGTGKSVVFQGAGKDFTTIKLRDNTFTDASNPLPVLSTTNGSSFVSGYTNIAFMTSVFDLTVDVGTGNPGAIGIRYIANNQGSIRDVKVISSDPEYQGYAGIDMARATIPGPCLIKNVEVNGFDYGFRIDNLNYGATMEDIVISNSRVNGIYNNNFILNARKVTTQNISGPSLNSPDLHAFVTLLECDFNGTGDYAIYNNGYLYLRNITSANYSNTLYDDINDSTISGDVSEFISHEIKALAESAPTTSLNLGNGNIPETPEVIWSDTSNWVSVLDFGYELGDPDAGPAIQAAIDHMNLPENASKNILYFPWGDYNIETPVTITGNVLKVIGNFAGIFSTAYKDDTPAPLFVIEDTDYPEIFIERMNLVPQVRRKRFAVFQNNSAKDVVFRHVYIGHGQAYVAGSAAGRLFIEDMCSLSQVYYTKVEDPFVEARPQFDFGSQEVWARQLNPEQRFTHISSDGGQVWILGIKTEEPGTVIYAKNGARVELLGGTILPSFEDIGESMFVVENAEASFVVTEHISTPKFNNLAWYKNIVKEIRGDVYLVTDFIDYPKRNYYGTAIPLYVAYGGNVTPEYHIEIQKDTLYFDDTVIESSQTLEFRIYNRGNTILNITGINLPAGFTKSWNDSAIFVDKFADVSVAFNPTEIKEYSGKLQVVSNATSGNDTLYLNATGIAKKTRILEIQNQLNFGEVEVGNSKTLELIILNQGNDILQISNITHLSVFSADWVTAEIPPGESQSLSVTFTPEEVKDYSSSIRFESNLTQGQNSIIANALGIKPTITSTDSYENIDFNIYPNPVGGNEIINISDYKSVQKIKILTLNGKLIFDRKVDKPEMGLNNSLKSGAYIVKIYKNNGDVLVNKIVLE